MNNKNKILKELSKFEDFQQVTDFKKEILNDFKKILTIFKNKGNLLNNVYTFDNCKLVKEKLNKGYNYILIIESEPVLKIGATEENELFIIYQNNLNIVKAFILSNELNDNIEKKQTTRRKIKI